MANSKAISVRIPDELLEKIDKLANEKYKSHKGTPNRSLVVLDAIVVYFNTSSATADTNMSDSVSIVDFQELKQEVDTLKDTVRQLVGKSFTVSDNVDEHEVKELKHNQLSIVTVSDSVDEGLTASQLADRLGKKHGDVTSKKYQSKQEPQKFIDWSKKLDPEGQGWEFRQGKSKTDTKYYPVAEPLA
jgi:hypothetical protein